MKVVTSTAAYNLKPSLAGFNFDYPVSRARVLGLERAACATESGRRAAGPCRQHAPDLVRPWLRRARRAGGRPPILRQQAELFGINSVPPIDLPAVGASAHGGRGAIDADDAPGKCAGVPGIAAIGQREVADTALQNAMIAAGIANGGVVMTPT